MQKRGQITLFIVLGVVILLVFLSLYLIISKYNQEASEQDTSRSVRLIEDMKPVEGFANDCIVKTTTIGLLYNGLRGGYTNVTKDPFFNESGTKATANMSFINSNEGYNVAYYIENKTVNITTKEQIQEKLQKYVEVKFDECMEGVTIFSDIGLDINLPDVNFSTEGWSESKLIHANITIGKENVFAKIYYPITISREDAKRTIDTFGGTIPIRLGMIYDNFIGNLTKNIISNWTANQAYEIHDFNCSVYGDNFLVHTDQISGTNTTILKIIDSNYGNTSSIGTGYSFYIAVSNGTITGDECDT